MGQARGHAGTQVNWKNGKEKQKTIETIYISIPIILRKIGISTTRKMGFLMAEKNWFEHVCFGNNNSTIFIARKYSQILNVKHDYGCK